MLKSKWVSFIFILALASAISVTRSIAPPSHGNDNTAHNNNQELTKPYSRHISELPASAHFSNSDFITDAQVNFSLVNLIEEDEDEDDNNDCLLSAPCHFLAVLSPF